MTKPDTKEIFEIAYAFKTAQWGTPQPIQFLPQAHKFGEDVFNLIEAYDEAQKRITELEEVTTNHCDLNQDRVLKLEALLRDVFREVIDSETNSINLSTLKCIQKELGEG